MSWNRQIVAVAAFLASSLAWAGAGPSTDSCDLVGGTWYKFSCQNSNVCFDVGVQKTSGAVLQSVIDKKCPAGYGGASGLPGNSGYCDSADTPWWISTTSSPRVFTVNNASVTSAGNIFRHAQTDPVNQCPSNEPDPVVCDSNYVDTYRGSPLQPDESGLAPFFCDSASSCIAAKQPGTAICGDAGCTAKYKIIDSPCETGVQPVADITGQPTPPSLECHPIGDAEYCVSQSQNQENNAQCGYLNGVPVCIDSTPKTGCKDVGGGMLCDPAASAPPAPDDGVTPGTPAPPDGQVKAAPANQDATQTYNYYNNTTINNSSVPPVSGQAEPGKDSDGDGFTDQGEEFGDGKSASGGGTCSGEAPACSGDAIQCAILLQQWKTRCDITGTPSDLDMESTFNTLPNRQEQEDAINGVGIEPINLAETFDQAPIISGGCWADYPLTVLGTAVMVPLSSLCTLFSWGGIIVVIVALMGGARIVAGGL